MELIELVGGVLDVSSDPMASGKLLAEVLMHTSVTTANMEQLTFEGIDLSLVDALRPALPQDREWLQLVCALGAAWVIGRRTVSLDTTWEPVATVPPGASQLTGLRRTTGETLIKIATEATSRIRFAAPFIDDAGISVLEEALAAATLRGVQVEVVRPLRSRSWPEAASKLTTHVGAFGDPRRLTLSSLRLDGPWAHLKVMIADGVKAYVGSANLTGPGMIQGNLEFGVLITGPQVAVFDRLLDAYTG